MDSTNNIVDLARERRRRGPRFNGDLMDILEVSRDMVCLCRDGAITAINGAGARMLGSPSTEQLLGRQMSEFLIPEYVRVLELFLAGLSSEDKPVPTRIKGLDGSTTSVEMQVYRAREIANTATVVVCRDITHEGRLAQDGYQTEQRFRMLVDHAMNLVCHVIDGKIVYMNHSGCIMLHTSQDGLINRDLSCFLHSDYHAILDPDLLDSVIEDDAAVPLRLVRLDGTAFDAMVMFSRLPSHRGHELMVEARDITAHNNAVTALRRANETLEQRVEQRTRELAEQRGLADAARRFSEGLIEAIPNPVWFKGRDGQVQTCNRSFRALFGDHIPTPSPLGHIMPDQDRITDGDILAGRQSTARFEASLPLADGIVDVVSVKSALTDDNGIPLGIIGVLTDISQRKEMETELRRLATIDPLTGCFNRRHFISASETEIERSRRYGHALSVIMLDIDHFKQINDTHGHAVGDTAIRTCVSVCRDTVREQDMVGRLGGEEFAILLPETDLDGAADVAERLRQRIEAIRIPLDGGGIVRFTASLGVAARLDQDREVASLLGRADTNLYKAKSAGRNQVDAG